MKEYVLSLKEKNPQHWFCFFQISRKYYICVKLFYDSPVKYHFWHFWYMKPKLYRIEFSCLYFPQGYYFIRDFLLWSTDEYVIFLILSESPSLMYTTLMKLINLKQSAVNAIFYEYLVCCSQRNVNNLDMT